MLLTREPSEKLDPRVRRTRRLLQQALTELMAEKNFRSITVQDIAERATVNRVTFYAHFADKNALLEYTIREGFRQRLRSRLPQESPYTAENLAQLLKTVCEFLSEMGSQCPPPHGQMEPLMEKQIKAEVYQVLWAWLADSPPSPNGRGPLPEQAAMVTAWSIYGAAVQWSQQERRQPVEAFVEQVLPILLAGLHPPAGSASIGGGAASPARPARRGR